MDKLEPSGIAKENAERHCHCGEPFSRFQKLKTESPCDPAVLFLGIFPEDAEAVFPEALFTTANEWRQPRGPSVVNGYTKCELCTVGRHHA